MIIEITRMKASPSGYIAIARVGLRYPSATAINIAKTT
jgi:hypothetical protein